MKTLRGRVFRRYVLSYLAVALTISLILGLALTMVSATRLRQSELELYESRLYMAADYIERQISAMEDIRVEIKANRVYQPFFLEQSVVNELELLDAFSRFTSYSSWVEEYYLWYQDTDRIFGTHAAYSPDIFYSRLLGGVTEGELAPLLAMDRTVHMQVLSQRPDSLIITMPFYFGSSKQKTNKAVLLFLVRLDTIRKTMWDMIGTESGAPLKIVYQDQTILSASLSQDAISAAGAEGNVWLMMDGPSFPTFHRFDSFLVLILSITFSVLLLGAALAVYAAWYSYRPIQRLYKKYIGVVKKPSNELQSIEELLNTTLEINRFSQQQLDDQLNQISHQHAWLKQQLVMMLISGNNSPVVQRQIRGTGFEMTHGLYAILFIHIHDCQPGEDFLRDVENFSDDELCLYAAELRSLQEYAVLINFEEEDQCQELLELLSDTMAAHNVTAFVQLSRSCSTLSGIVSVAMEALNACPVSLPAETKNSGSQEDSVTQVLELAEAGNAQQALSLLDILLAGMDNRYPSVLMKLCMMNTLYARISRRAAQVGAAVSAPPEASSLQEPSAIAQQMRRLVKAIASTSTPVAEYAGDARASKIVGYIRDNCLSTNISLSSTAQAFEISTKQVTRLLRMSIGMTFKEYLLQLRMEAAKRILVDDGFSIAETAEKVGYFNTSHFIKCFKLYTGLTPGEWKKNTGH